MIKSEREKQILNLLNKNDGYISVNELSKNLYASPSSIRRDLSRLEKSGNVKRCYGGAELITSYSGSIPFNYRFLNNENAKRIIAQKAISLVKENSVIFLDQSSTAFYLATMLKNIPSLTVVTNNVEIVNLLLQTKINVISSGGSLLNENRTCLAGEIARQTFSKMYADLAIISSKSISLDGVISDLASEEVAVRQALINNAKKVAYLCDGSKIGNKSPYIQCNLSKIDYLVSDVDCSAFKKSFSNLTVL